MMHPIWKVAAKANKHGSVRCSMQSPSGKSEGGKRASKVKAASGDQRGSKPWPNKNRGDCVVKRVEK